jgi:predicted acetyltransferase
MTELRIPDESLYEPWLAAVTDYDGVGLDGSGQWMIEGFGADRRSFDALLAATREEGDERNELSGTRVHSTYTWIFDGPGDEAEMVGFLAIRHRLNDFLLRKGGHIGYSVRPSRRREGHASRALGLALPQARRLGIDRALVTCDDDNVGSLRTIESQGAVLENIEEGNRRYWIDLA